MEKVNRITGMSDFTTDNWCNRNNFIEYPELKQYVSEKQYDALMNYEADIVAFRIDE